jgi:hypothetical protein
MSFMSSKIIDRAAIEAIEIGSPEDALAARNWRKFEAAIRNGIRFQATLDRTRADIGKDQIEVYTSSLAVQLLALGHTPQEAIDVLVYFRTEVQEIHEKSYYVDLLTAAAERVESVQKRADLIDADLIDADLTAAHRITRDFILVNKGPLREKVDAAIYALQKHSDIYTRDGKAAALRRDTSGLVHIEMVTPDRMKLELTRSCEFLKEGKTKTHVSPPADIVKGVLAHPTLPLPRIDGIAHAPFTRKDGSLCSASGYDIRAHNYLDDSLAFDSNDIDQPSQERARQSYQWLDREVFGQFPIQNGTSYLVAAMLAGVCMELIDGPTPMIGITAPAPNSGKTLLASVISTVLTGREVITSAPASKEEWRKQTFSLLREGASVICFDNIRGPIASPVLEGILTSRYYRGRILGVSEDATVINRAVWLATGNNLQRGGDMSRRMLLVELGKKQHAGQYKRANLLAWTREHRSEILGALWQQLANYTAFFSRDDFEPHATHSDAQRTTIHGAAYS